MLASLRPRPVASRVQAAGLMMVVGTGIWALMPVAVALGADISGGIGVFLVGSKTPLIVTESMLPWLWPVSLATAIAGALLVLGRDYRFGLVMALTWVGIAVIATPSTGQPQLLMAATLVAFLVYSGRGGFESGAAQSTGAVS